MTQPRRNDGGCAVPVCKSFCSISLAAAWASSVHSHRAEISHDVMVRTREGVRCIRTAARSAGKELSERADAAVTPHGTTAGDRVSSCLGYRSPRELTRKHLRGTVGARSNRSANCVKFLRGEGRPEPALCDTAYNPAHRRGHSRESKPASAASYAESLRCRARESVPPPTHCPLLMSPRSVTTSRYRPCATDGTET